MHVPAEASAPTLDEYQQRVARTYGARAANYETTPVNSDWHRRIAALLVKRAQLQPGQRVLDIATGTGLVACDAAERVGSEGDVLGIDMTSAMLEQARRKATALRLQHLHFMLADAEKLRLPLASFDHVMCCTALVLMRDVPRALAQWLTLLAPGGWLGLQTNPDTAFVTSRVVQQLAATMGIHLRLSQEVGTPERLYSLLDAAGFVDIEIHVEPDGHFLTMEQALAAGPDYEFPAPGQYPPPLRACTSMQMASLREAYEQSMRAACTPQGIWNDCTSLLARARRP